MKKIHSFVCGMLVIGFITATAWADERIIFGTTPWKSPKKMYQMYQPLMKYLAEQLGKETVFIVTKDYSDLIEQIRHQRIDIAIFSPNSYVVAKETLPDLHYLATPLYPNPEGLLQPYYSGVIFVSKSSSIRSLQDLEGKTFGFTDPLSTSGYIFPMVLLRKNGIDPETHFSKIFFLKKHDKVISAVANHVIDGGATADDVLSQAREQHGDIFRELAGTAIIPHNAHTAASHVPDELCKAIQKALTSITPDSTVIQDMKEHGYHGKAFAVMDDTLYDGIREARTYIPE